ncbi:hypothetical protein RchiOBHm_Chr7g0199801 [Rosa chinensis]|uniref:Uncharacterized protein n=1 Tax=Rosa chinensis TaxID=74649 RepID=A0A2P6P7G7_ROSCH|nr:hypothetical protein RchiOBHm_Chr7g0199801 [Rosa chinensis]
MQSQLSMVEAIMDPATFLVVWFIMSSIPFLPFMFQSRSDVQTRNAGIELGFWISLSYLLEALGYLHLMLAVHCLFPSLQEASSNLTLSYISEMRKLIKRKSTESRGGGKL